MWCLNIVYTKLQLCSSYHAFSPTRGIVVVLVEPATDHGTVAVTQSIRTDLPFFYILLIRLHPDTEQEHHRHHAPVPAIIRVQGCVELGPAPLEERGWINKENKVHLHLLVVAPERPAAAELSAQSLQNRCKDSKRFTHSVIRSTHLIKTL
jgi:hypothetical protein